MPIYQFICKDCGWDEEMNLPMSNREHPGTCCMCGGEFIRKWGVGGVVIR